MTDGPYRSLPMTPSWKKAAQLLAQEASSQAALIVGKSKNFWGLVTVKRDVSHPPCLKLAW